MQGVGLVDRSAPPHNRGWELHLHGVLGARLGAGHADGRGVCDGPAPAARVGFAGACSGRGCGSHDPGSRVRFEAGRTGVTPRSYPVHDQ